MEYQQCKRCVMDNVSDTSITFSEEGFCNYCTEAIARMNKTYFPTQEGRKKLEKAIGKIKADMKNREFDCLVGLSGGLDSSYLAYLSVKLWKLRLLALHIDDGFNSEIAEHNINLLGEKLGIRIIRISPNQKIYNDILRSYIISGVPGIANPQDNILLASLYKYMRKTKVKYFFSGANFSLESILERGEGVPAADGKQIISIHKLYGKEFLDNIELTNLFEHYISRRYLYRLKTIRPLDFIDYNRDVAIKTLQDEIGFEYYGGKHYESIFTKFVQTYYLPTKFNIDKRKSHYSSMIVSGQMTRESAKDLLKIKPYDDQTNTEIIDFVLSRICLSHEDFQKCMNAPPKSHLDYPNSILNKFAAQARRYRKYIE